MHLHIIKKFIFLIFILNVTQVFSNTDDFVSIIFKDQEIHIKAEKAKLSNILTKIKEEFNIKIFGLKFQKDDELTFNIKGKSESEIIKRILKYIGEDNYIFEFNDDNLDRVYIFSKGRNKGSYISNANEQSQNSNLKRVPAVRIQSVVPSSQADTISLQKGDYIVVYDGIYIKSAQQLVKEVKKRSESDRVELVIIRNKSPRSYIINGGLIGVHIITTMVNESELGSY